MSIHKNWQIACAFEVAFFLSHRSAVRTREWKAWCLGAAILAWATCSFRLSAQSTIEQLPTKINEAYNLYREASMSIQGKCLGRNTQVEKGVQVRKIEYEYQIKQGMTGGAVEVSRTTDEAGKVKSYGRVIGRNSKYVFELTKGQNKGWLLSDIKFDPMRKMALQGLTVDEELFFHVSPHYRFVNNQPLAAALKDPEFKILKRRSNPVEGRPAVQIDFELPQRKNKEVSGTYQGTITLDAEFWCILRQDAEFLESGGGKRLITVTYTIDATKSGKGKILTMTSKLDYEKDSRQVENRFELYYDDNVAEREFSLSAFGLPEAQGVVWDSPTRYTLWFGLAGVVALLIALCFRYLSRRNPAMPAEPVAPKGDVS
jgi:hypothetical protein